MAKRKGFYVSLGYVQDGHRGRLGGAYGTFLWFVAHQTGRDGKVNRGKPVRVRCGSRERTGPGCCMSHDLGLSRHQVMRDIRVLSSMPSPSSGQPYLEVTRTQYGLVVTIPYQKKFPSEDPDNLFTRSSMDATSEEPSRSSMDATSQMLHGCTSDVAQMKHLTPSRCSINVTSHHLTKRDLDQRSSTQSKKLPGREGTFLRSWDELHQQHLGRPFRPIKSEMGITRKRTRELLEVETLEELLRLADSYLYNCRKVQGTNEARFWLPTVRCFASALPRIRALEKPPEPSSPGRTQHPKWEEVLPDIVEAGARACSEGKPVDSNPYTLEEHPNERYSWSHGWQEEYRTGPDRTRAQQQ
jgi:hypothetical protein